MPNPFEKRATEYLRDDEAFLAVVTPRPLTTFFGKPARDGRLYDRLTMVIGTPGSGKTTLARLFQFRTIRTLLHNSGISSYRPLLDELTKCGAVEDDRPAVIGGRIPLEAEYREFWEFPYSQEIKAGLMISLLQARSVLAWLQSIRDSNVRLDQVEVISGANPSAAVTSIGGTTGESLFEQARKVELAIYPIVAALVPPEIEEIEPDAVAAYRPFDVIESFRIHEAGNPFDVLPLIILDDAHRLHPEQLEVLTHWLAQRELKIARWILTRLDALNPRTVLASREGSELNRSREVTVIHMQGGQGGQSRRRRRQEFRRMAQDMAGRYLSQMEVFNSRKLNNLGTLLSADPDSIPEQGIAKLVKHVSTLQRRYGVLAERLQEFEKNIDSNLGGTVKNSKDLRLGILAILLERYVRRFPQTSLFESVTDNAQPSRPLNADASVAEGARIHLLHEYGRPYFFGIDTLCDASSDNAEQFLRLASRLVSQAEIRLIRGKQATLSVDIQHKLLRERAEEIVDEWDFPHCHEVRRLAEGIAKACLAKSLERNASLGGGANGFGIPKKEFDSIPKKYPDLARILQYGVAYNAFVLVPNDGTKGRQWYVIELGGILILKYGLTLNRGGFLERNADDLLRILDGH